jgi:hypothetical protein
VIVRNALAYAVTVASGIENSPSSIPERVEGIGAEFWSDFEVETGVLDKDVEALTAEELLLVVAHTARVFQRWAQEHPTLSFHLTPACSFRGILLFLLGPEIARRLTSSGPVEPKRPEMTPEKRRAGYPQESPHREQGISTRLASRMVSYFIHFGADIPDTAEKLRRELTAHDAHEICFFLGDPSRPKATCKLPLLDETKIDPWASVDSPLVLSRHEALLIDAHSPHFAYAPPGSVALFVAASEEGLFVDPSAFRASNIERVPGVAYPFTGKGVHKPSARLNPSEDKPGKKAIHRLIGSRLRRHRDVRGISVQMLQSPRIVVHKNYIGKLEAGQISNIQVGALLRVIDALDMSPVELLSDSPSPVMSFPQLTRTSQAVPLLKAAEHARFVVRPFAVSPPAFGPRTRLVQGHGDAVILVLNGSVDLLIVPDGFLCLLALARIRTRRSRARESGEVNALSISSAEQGELLAAGHILRERLGANSACQFNAARFHSLVATEKATLLGVVTRTDDSLPSEWVK